MSDQIPVSVIIPCFNSEKFVEETLLSVLAQTHKNFEIICVDDGSTDSTNLILEKYQKQFSFIQLVKNDGKGAAAARNTGLKLSVGKYIQFLDSDDIILPFKFEQQLSSIGADMIVSDYERRDNKLENVLKCVTFETITNEPLDNAIHKIIITANPLYKRDFVIKLNGYDSSLRSAQDWDFNLRAVLQDPVIVYVKGVFFYHRNVEGSISYNWLNVAVDQCRVLNKLKGQIMEHKQYSQKILEHVLFMHYNAMVFLKNKDLIKEIDGYFKHWYTGDLNFIKSRFKRSIARIIGVQNLIRLNRLLK
jgi:glycosyltransferase involved in cell wall biosynthesis